MIPQKQKQICQVISSRNLHEQRMKKRVIHYDLLTQKMFAVVPEQLNQQPLTKEHQCVDDYFDEIDKDNKKQKQYKQKLYRRYLNKEQEEQDHQKPYHKSVSLKKQRNSLSKYRISENKKTQMLKDGEIQIASRSLISPSSQKKSQILHKRQYSKLIDDLISSVNFENNYQNSERRKKLRTKSQISKQKQIMMKKERQEIMRYIKQNDNKSILPPPIASNEMFKMDYNRYLKQKSHKRIESEFLERRKRLNEKPLQKFQQFILREVKFTKQNKDKLEDFFSFIREEFRRIERH